MVQPSLISNCGWILGIGRHGLGQLLLGYRHLVSYSSENETNRRIL